MVISNCCNIILTIKGTTIILFLAEVVIRPINMVRIQTNQSEHGMLTNIVPLGNNTSGRFGIWFIILYILVVERGNWLLNGGNPLFINRPTSGKGHPWLSQTPHFPSLNDISQGRLQPHPAGIYMRNQNLIGRISIGACPGWSGWSLSYARRSPGQSWSIEMTVFLEILHG